MMIYRINLHLPPYKFKIDLYVNFIWKVMDIKFQAK